MPEEHMLCVGLSRGGSEAIHLVKTLSSAAVCIKEHHLPFYCNMSTYACQQSSRPVSYPARVLCIRHSNLIFGAIYLIHMAKGNHRERKETKKPKKVVPKV